MNEIQKKTAEAEFHSWWRGMLKGQAETAVTAATRDAMKIGFLAGYEAHLEAGYRPGIE